MLNALKTHKATFLNEVRNNLDLIDLDGGYEGVMVSKNNYDPDEMGRDWAVDIIRNINQYVDAERGEVLENVWPFEEELTLLEKYVIDDMAINSYCAHATLWFAKFSDATGIIEVALAQYEDWSRVFLEFSESREDTLSRFNQWHKCRIAVITETNYIGLTDIKNYLWYHSN